MISKINQLLLVAEMFNFLKTAVTDGIDSLKANDLI